MTEGVKDKITKEVSPQKSEGSVPTAAPKKLITLTRTRKSNSLFRTKDTSGKAKTISVQVRRKRTYVKSSEGLIDEEANRAKEAREAEERLSARPIQVEGVKEVPESTTSGRSSAPERPSPEVGPIPSTQPVAEGSVTATGPDEAWSTSVEAEKKLRFPEKTHSLFGVSKERAEREKRHKARSLKEKEITKYRHKVTYPLEEDTDDTIRHRRKLGKPKRVDQFLQQQFERPTAAVRYEISIPESITVAELAQKMSVKAVEVIKSLMKLGVMGTINQPIDQDTAVIVAEEMGHIAKPIRINALEEGLAHSIQQQMGELQPRPPVVTIMGHVNHGKTSLLDYIRRTKVTQGEAGGITQHIGAYHVEIPQGVITFLDTPGHSAFAAMRARGTRVTDIVVLVVAADDGVMPQTVEAIQHARAAQVPIVVAVNKMDKPEADMERIKNELAQQGLVPEEWGGDTMFIPVSAKTGVGIDNLLASLLVQAEVLELKAPQEGPGQGIVIESRLDKGRGPVVTLLIQRGRVSKGDLLLAGVTYGRVRALLDERGHAVDSVGPSMPVEVLGLSSTPVAGDEAVVVSDERKAREIALSREIKLRENKLAGQRALTKEDMFAHLGQAGVSVLNIILKADVQGSVEALKEALNALSTPEVKLKLVYCGVGAITESDANLAVASKAMILGFNVRADAVAKRIVEREGLIMHYHSVIYDLLAQVKDVMSGLLSPEIKETILGLAEVREVFRSTKLGVIAGCMITQGLVRRNALARVLRDHVVIHEAEICSLRRFKEDVAEVRYGTECGVGIKNFLDIRTGDMIEAFERTTIARKVV